VCHENSSVDHHHWDPARCRPLCCLGWRRSRSSRKRRLDVVLRPIVVEFVIVIVVFKFKFIIVKLVKFRIIDTG
jgi:hypothetical protein